MDATAPAVRSNTLALLLQDILTTIVRIQSGKQPLQDLETLRRHWKRAIQEFEREAGIAGYSSTEVRESEFAAVAFIDETILSTRDPKAEEWKKRPLINELFGVAVAGDAFYDRLTDLERGRDSAHLADVLEVYVLCLLLGFEGRYAPPLRAEANRIAERLRRRIEAIRGLDYKLSPSLSLATPGAESAPAAPRSPWRMWALSAATAFILLFIIYYFSLAYRTGQVESMVGNLR
jgi:type VI secretion system protein ImpK